MKRIQITLGFALVAGLAALATGCARPAYLVKSDAADEYMQGHVRQIRETYFDDPADPNVLPGSLGEHDTYTVVDYNRAGNITRMDAFKGPDSLQTDKEGYFYDTSGERLERSETHDLARRGITVVLYRYDEGGRLTGEVESNGFYRFDLGYDRHGYLKTRAIHSPDMEKSTVIARYYYDCRGRLRRVKGERRQRYRYHPGGIVAEIREGKTDRYLYDERGNLTTSTTVVTRRNEEGRVTERFPVTISAEYELDARGNWIRRVQLFKGEGGSVSVREIEYWDEGAGEGARR